MPGHYINDNLNTNIHTFVNSVYDDNEDQHSCIKQEMYSVPSLSRQIYPTDYQHALGRNRYSMSEVSSVTTSNSGDSDCSSTLGMGTPDIALSEMISDSILSAGYSSLLHGTPRLHHSESYSYLKPCDTALCMNDYQQFNPLVNTSVYFQNRISRGLLNECSDSLNLVQQQTLSQDNNYSLLSTLVNENQATYFPERYSEELYAYTNCDTSSISYTQSFLGIADIKNEDLCPAQNNPLLVQLSRKELIQRVVQLESERNTITQGSDVEGFYSPINQENPDSFSKYIYSCKWIGCNALAPTLAKLMAHICEIHVGSGKATYACEWTNCIRNKKPFLKRHKMYNHMRTHTGERPFICTVSGCKKTFSRPDSLSTHVKTHSNIRPYLCTVPGCQKAYFHSRSLRKHIKSTHMKNTISSARNTTPNQYK